MGEGIICLSFSSPRFCHLGECAFCLASGGPATLLARETAHSWQEGREKGAGENKAEKENRQSPGHGKDESVHSHRVLLLVRTHCWGFNQKSLSFGKISPPFFHKWGGLRVVAQKQAEVVLRWQAVPGCLSLVCKLHFSLL
jgi:hypothetical protein